MKKTVREWIAFLNQGNNHFIGLEHIDSKTYLKKSNYIACDKALEVFDGWLDDIPIKFYINNFEENGNYYHVLILPSIEEK